MPAGTDRYNAPLDPGAQLEERLRRIEQQLNALQGRNPLNNAVFSGTLRSADPTTGDTTLEITGSGIEAFDPAGASVFDLDGTGLTIPNGAIEVGGGPVRAMDIDFATSEVTDTALTTTMTAVTTSTLTVPDWANTAVVFGWIVFQMSNSTAGVQRQRYRVTIDGWPSSGGWDSDVQPSGVMNVGDTQLHTLTRGVDLGATIPVSAVCGVATGTNNANIIRIRALAFFLR